MPSAAFHTLGCKTNQYETEGVLEIFKNRGYDIANFDEKADIYVINTCTVTHLADRKSRQMISKARKTNEDAVIVVMGCYAQTSADEVSQIQGVNLIVGTKDRVKIVELVEEYIKNKNQIKAVDNIMNTRKFEEIPISAYEGRTRAFLKIQEGCTQFCSYCIIPYARGPIRSRKLDEIINEVKKLAQHGFKEIVLTGIHIASYGRDLKNGNDILTVEEEIEKVDGIERIRFGSLEPTLITNEFIEKLIKLNKMCPHFHLSLQSGSGATLKRMNRKYDTDTYRKAVELIRSNYNNASITTDIMVGFPGETEKEFEESYNFAKEMKFAKIHVFKFSPRKGTPAAGFSNQVAPAIKEERSKRLIELSNICEREFCSGFLNTFQDVLFEQKLNGMDELMEGLTSNYITVAAEYDQEILGNIKKVRLKEIKEEYILGVVEN